jgi:predicted amidohydrolase
VLFRSAARGADLLLQPTAWVNAGTPAAPWNPQPDFLIRSRAAEFGVPCASASKWGVEGDTLFVGSSLICDARGEVVVQCGQAETCVATAEVALQRARRPVLTEAERAAFRTGQVPTLTAPQGPLRLVAIADDAGDDTIAKALRPRRGQSACMLGIRVSDREWARGLLVLDEQRGLDFAPLGDSVERAGVRVVGLAAAETEHFPGIRRQALSGVHAVVAFGADARRVHLQARACENRVFVIQITRTSWRVFGPTGQMLVERAPEEHQTQIPDLEIDVSAAVDKEVARGTHVFAQCAGTRLEG